MPDGPLILNREPREPHEMERLVRHSPHRRKRRSQRDWLLPHRSARDGPSGLGVALFLFGLASLFYPPLKLIIGSVTTSVAIIGGGIALMILPSLIVGNELLILAGVAAAVGIWFFAHRHGQLRGLVDAAESALVTPPDNSGKAGGL